MGIRGGCTHLKMFFFTGGVVAHNACVDPNRWHPWPPCRACPGWARAGSWWSPLDGKIRSDFSFICQVTHLSYPSLCPRLWWVHLNSLNRQGGSNHGAVVLPGRGWNSEVCLWRICRSCSCRRWSDSRLAWREDVLASQLKGCSNHLVAKTNNQIWNVDRWDITSVTKMSNTNNQIWNEDRWDNQCDQNVKHKQSDLEWR